jgi:hypothetical protein
MKIYLIQHTHTEWDAYMGHVIVANNKEEVIKIATEKAQEEGKRVWKTAKITEYGQYTGDKTEPFVVLSDFNAG